MTFLIKKGLKILTFLIKKFNVDKFSYKKLTFVTFLKKSSSMMIFPIE